MELTDNQLNLLNILQFVNKASIYGCAGSGKTLLAIKKAEQLSNQGLRTLLVCFNNILGLHLSKSINNDKLWASNFHSIVQRLFAEHDIKDVDLFSDSQILDTFLSYDFPKFDCLLIDEAQDFSKDQMDVLHLLLKESGIIYYFWDANQRIIRKDLYVPDDVQRFPLNTNLRNTEHIFNHVKEHYRQDLTLMHRGPQGRQVQTLPPYSKDKPQELFTKLRSVLNQLLINEELKPEDITILTFKAKNKTCLNEFNFDHCELRLFEDGETKNAIRIDTVRRFKGMEANVVIVCEMDDQNCMQDPELFEEMRYVAYSRAKHHLIIMPYVEI
jgi:DNA helicase IV